MRAKNHKTSHYSDEIDQQILNLKCEHPAITDNEIGKAVGLSREAVTRRRNRRPYQEALVASHKVTLASLEKLFSKAIGELGNLIQDPDPRIRLMASSAILKQMPQLPIKAMCEQENSFKIGRADEAEELPQEIVYVSRWGNQEGT